MSRGAHDPGRPGPATKRGRAMRALAVCLSAALALQVVMGAVGSALPPLPQGPLRVTPSSCCGARSPAPMGVHRQ